MSKTRSPQDTTGSLRVRKNFARIPQVVGIPNLIEVQRKSFESFLQDGVAPKDRELNGLEEVFHDVFPISDLNLNASIEYIGYEVGVWECGCGEYGELGSPGLACDECGYEIVRKERHRPSECRHRGLTYTDPIKIMVRLVLYDREAVDLNAKTIKNLAGKYILEDVKYPQKAKVLFPARTEITDDVIQALQNEKIP